MARRYSDVMRDLLDAVVGGEYREGEWLPTEAELRARFGCGRGVLREALRGMQERGLIVVHAGRGQRVMQRESWDTRDPQVLTTCIERGPEPAILADTIDARAAVEEAAAVRAIEHATDADLAQLAARIEVMDRALAPGAGRSMDARDPLVVAETWFHHQLAVLSGNTQLAKLVEPLHIVLAELRRVQAPARDAAVVRHHRRILEGLSSREEELAAAAVTGYAERLAGWLGARR
jgi:GntR family transcriptional regulator, transcriptional repressor for pyruvate dehydrogenase complex